jgi:hypothetical protein
MTQDTSGNTSENTLEDWAEFLTVFFVMYIEWGLNPVVVILLLIPMTVPATALEQPIVKDMLIIGMVQYLEFWILDIYLASEYLDRKRPITPRDVGALLLDTIPFFGLAFYALLHPMSTVLKTILVIYGTIGGLPTMIILAGLLNAPWLLPGGLLKDP